MHRELKDNASVNYTCAHLPPGNPGAFAHLLCPGGGAFTYPGQPQEFDTCGFKTVKLCTEFVRNKDGGVCRKRHDYVVEWIFLKASFLNSIISPVL